MPYKDGTVLETLKKNGGFDIYTRFGVTASAAIEIASKGQFFYVVVIFYSVIKF